MMHKSGGGEESPDTCLFYRQNGSG